MLLTHQRRLGRGSPFSHPLMRLLLLPPGTLTSVTPAQQKLILEYHALTKYYTLGSLNTLNDATAPTLATTDNGAGTYTMNVSTGATGVTLYYRVSIATITSASYDTPPTVVFAINTILLHPAIFATAPAPAPVLGPVFAPAPSNGSVPVPALSPLTPTPAPSPLTPSPTPIPSPSPSPTPTPTPASASSPSSTSPTASPVPAVSPAPPAPPGKDALTPEIAPAEAPKGSVAMSRSMNLAILVAMTLGSSMVSLMLA